MTPFYRQLPDLPGFGVERTADVVGLALAVGATAGVTAHAVATGVQRMRHRSAAEEQLPKDIGAPSEPGSTSDGSDRSDKGDS
jgi:hydrogenase small subunit